MGINISKQSFLFMVLAIAVFVGIGDSLGAHDIYSYEPGVGTVHTSDNSVYTITNYGRILHSKVAGGYAVGNRVYTINGLSRHGGYGLGIGGPVAYRTFKDVRGDRLFTGLGAVSPYSFAERNIIGGGHGLDSRHGNFISLNLGHGSRSYPYAPTASASSIGSHRLSHDGLISLGGRNLDACTNLFEGFNHGRNIRNIYEGDLIGCEDFFEDVEHEFSSSELRHVEGFNDCRQLFQDFNKDHDRDDISPSDVIGCQDFFAAFELYG